MHDDDDGEKREDRYGMGWGVKLGGGRNVELGDVGPELIDPLCGWLERRDKTE